MPPSPPNTAPGPLETACTVALQQLAQTKALQRLWQRDFTLWKEDPDEIDNRLGWLDSPAEMPAHLEQIKTFTGGVKDQGFTHALLLGMGGSSLAPEVLRRIFGVAPDHLDLGVLDSTDPAAVAHWDQQLDLSTTLFVPATKSGGTVETMSLLKYFYNRTLQTVGPERAGSHFAAITDPGSGLADLAARLKFRHTFLNNPDIGGRYSALSFFGMVPAALIGADIETLLAAGGQAAQAGQPDGDGQAAGLAAYMAAGARQGRDKLTLISSPQLAPLEVWIEQLIAESTGKEGQGIVPVAGEALGQPQDYGADRLFVYSRLQGDNTLDDPVAALSAAGHPLLCLEVADTQALGQAFMQWELATALTGALMGINPFDQPDVEAAKVLGRESVEAYRREGSLPISTPDLEEQGIAVYGAPQTPSLSQALDDLLDNADATYSYIALQAYLPAGGEIDAPLERLRLDLRRRTGLAVTTGYGPRFLHSTGQLHKGDAGDGLFIQLTAEAAAVIPIPDEPGGTDSAMPFGVLQAAQALGDRAALEAAGRRILRLHLGTDPVAGLDQVCHSLPSAQ
ncbi:MAG: glucose-6-phosphate isomerase [Candidatus Latescibacteria bacterium]|nr:glucose-6-phosphate isomerase [Candidatus Latescibacterota bacterium]